ncbi:MAG: cohesin domain-containing protein [Opitutaceae bacterium]|jgi:hypothetical protein
MKNIKKFLLGCMVAAGIAHTASAQISLYLSPVSQTIGVDGLASYNLVVKGLKGSADYNGPALGGFDVQLDYNSAIASAQSVTFGSMLNLSQDDMQISDLSAPGVIYLSETSFDSPAALESAQTSSFTLATITLEGLTPGTTLLSFDSTYAPSLTNEDGFTLDLAGGAVGSSLAVIPEPSCTAGLTAALALGFCALRRKFSKKSDGQA